MTEASAVIAAPADRVFAVVTDIASLPEWNRGIRRVVEAPPELAEGAEWVVVVHAMGQSWPSRSRVVEFDRDRKVFAYRSQSDDGNPSFANWRWQVEEVAEGSRVTVTWELNPRTFWRRVLLVRLRRPGLAREVAASLVALRDRAAQT